MSYVIFNLMTGWSVGKKLEKVGGKKTGGDRLILVVRLEMERILFCFLFCHVHHTLLVRTDVEFWFGLFFIFILNTHSYDTFMYIISTLRFCVSVT